MALLLLFGVVYACSLTFEYVDGDDASSVAFHALGRNESVQPAYAEYQSGADLLLRLFPAHEPVLRVVAIALTAAAMVICTVLMVALASDLLGGGLVKRKWRLALVAALAMPELFYLGLVYQPPVIGMCLLLASHLILRRVLGDEADPTKWGRTSWGMAVLAAGLFGVGCAFRWNLVIYGWVIYWDWALGVGRVPTGGWRGYLNRGVQAFTWASVAGAVWLAVLAASGYGLQDINSYQEFARRWAGYRLAWPVLLASDLALVTPALVILSLWGLRFLLRSQVRLAVFAVICALPVLPLVRFWPKQLVWFFPILILCLAGGYVACFERNNHTRRARWAQAVVIALLVVPWVVGVRAIYGDTAWGPGFELRPYDREQASASSLNLTLGAGAAVSTPEGPRPLWGHGWVLLGGGWRHLTLELAADRSATVQTAIREGLPILVLEGGSGFMSSLLARSGFSGLGEIETSPVGPVLSANRFVNPGGQTVFLVVVADPLQWAGDARSIHEVAIVANGDRVVTTGYPGHLRSLYQLAPAAMRRIGPVSAAVSLNELTAWSPNRSVR